MKKLLIIFIAFTLSALSADILVVVSKKSSIGKLSKYEVKRIFLNKTRFSPNGEKVQIVESISLHIKNTFYHEVTDKSKSQLRSYWAKQVFTGKGRPPRQLKKGTLLSYLAQNPNAISYINSEQMTDALKVLYKIKK
jgi:ABC-type phosphate transport system substrate-binding protein